LSTHANGQESRLKNEVTQVELSKLAELKKVAGFAQYLKQDSDLFFNLSRTKNIVQYLRNSQLGIHFAEFAKSEGDYDINKELQRPGFQEFLDIVGEEVFFAMGDGTGKLVKSTGDLYAAYYQAYYAGLAGIMLKLYEGEDVFSNPESMQGMFEGMFKPMMEELAKLKDYKMPDTFIGIKVSDAEAREKYLNLVKGALKNADQVNQFLPDMEIPFELDSRDVYGGFEGVKVSYGKWMERLLANPEMGEAFKMMGMEGKSLKKYLEFIDDMNVSILVGEYQDYIVIYLGDSSSKLAFADNIDSSLVASKEMTFLGGYGGKEVTSISYVSEDVVEAFKGKSTIMEDLAGGLNKVLSGTETLGDTKHIQALLSKIAKNGRVAVDLVPASRFGSVGYIEDGYKIDSFHGGKSSLYNLNAKRKLSKIAAREEAVFSANWVNNEENSKLTIQRLEDAVNLVYQITKMVVVYDQEVDNADFQEFAAIFRMLDGQFSDDLLGVWNSIKTGIQQGMGNERALVVDLKGKMPRIPDVPTVLLENGLIPRVAIGADLKSREKMAQSWKELDVSSRTIAGKIEEVVGQKMNYRTPELAKKEGIDFWSYQLGITSHEANFALGINDKMAFITSSPAFVESFAADFDVDGLETGVNFKLQVKPMRSLARHWLKFIEENGEQLETGFKKDNFLKDKKLADGWMKASEEIDSLDYSVKKVDGEVRSFFHFNKAN